jgi:hypothetical protein
MALGDRIAPSRDRPGAGVLERRPDLPRTRGHPSLRQVRNFGHQQKVGLTHDAGAILIATSSNNVVKGVYAAVYSAGRIRFTPVTLVVLAVGGIVAAWLR